MQIIGLHLLCFVITGYHSFFIENKDIKKLLQLFPKAFDVEPAPKIRPLHFRRRDNDYRQRDEYTQDYDRYDNGENYKNTVKSTKGKLLGRYDSRRFHQPSYECDHPDHYHNRNKHTEDREKYHKHDEELSDYYEKKKQHKKKTETEKLEEGRIPHDKSKKDYITGVLITIPKVKNDDSDGYYKDSKQSFIQQLLKAENYEQEEEAEDDIKSYLY